MPHGARFEQSLLQLRAPLLRFARLQLPVREEAEDVVQESLLAALQMAQPPTAPAELQRYVFGILRHKVTDRIRARYRGGDLARPAVAAGDDEDFDAQLFDERGHWQAGVAVPAWRCPEGQLQFEQFLTAVERCLQRLPDKAARVFGMKVLLEMEAEEICADLALSRTDYWQSLSRARKQLQVCLNAQGFTGGPA